MTEQKNIYEGNILIAKFMNRNPPKENYGVLWYHKSWDWLTPVIEKIESLTKNFVSPYFNICNNYCVLHWQTDSLHPTCFRYLQSHCGNNKLQTLWECCVDFIKWYNKNESK